MAKEHPRPIPPFKFGEISVPLKGAQNASKAPDNLAMRRAVFARKLAQKALEEKLAKHAMHG